jgi:hypothetical protein
LAGTTATAQSQGDMVKELLARISNGAGWQGQGKAATAG